MNRLPSLPTSVAIIRDGTDIFLSFHFENDNLPDAFNLIRPLEFWLQLFLEMQGVVSVLTEVEKADG